ncbi:hypothetical protein JZ751_007764 [Albula glossodonta]|uniref:Uncharacterized protein n=1 Tax=Albula glossodonta TaxID=121402 RepID=A0A8T2P0T8_9TELE|nr:hypothetical protein JZ751_007764 [Albula glossodonta]
MENLRSRHVLGKDRHDRAIPGRVSPLRHAPSAISLHPELCAAAGFEPEGGTE